MTRTLLRLSTTLLAACALATAPAARAQDAPPAITYVTVDNPNAVGSTEVTGLNDFGQFLGIYADAQGLTHGFMGHVGSTHYAPLDYPGAAQTFPFRINNWGEIVGTYFDPAGIQHGFLRVPALLWWPAFYVPLNVPGAAPNPQFDYELGTGLGTSVFGLNDFGQIAGQYAGSDGVGRGFLLTGDGYTTYTFPGSSPVPGFFGGSALADINDLGDLAGEYAGSDPADPILLHGFLLPRHGKPTTIDPPGSVLTQLFGLNNRREVFGFFYDGLPPPYGVGVGHGYIYSKGHYQIINVPGAVYISTVGTVNNRREFVGEYVDGAGVTHGYIATRH